jgi:hypothetical protein
VLCDRPYADGLRRLRWHARCGAPHALRLLERDRGHAAGAAIAATVLEAAGNTRPPLLPWLWQALGHRRPRPIIRRPSFAARACGPDRLAGAGLVATIEEALDGATSEPLGALRSICEGAGWLVPHTRVCWLSARPAVVSTDTEGRLHSASGPALSYPDGWSLHAWKGVAVPAWVIERPREITLVWIDAEIDAPVRHAMIDIFTARRFVAEGGAFPVARDACGTLWRRTWTHRGTVFDRWSAVEYWHHRASGLQRVVEAVPAHLRSPAEAQDWLLGFSARSR